MEPGSMERMAELSLKEIESDFGYCPGYRAAQAKGVLCRGTFNVAAGIPKLTRAKAFAPGAETPVTVRFSDFTSDPSRHDGRLNVRGLAVKFHLDEGEQVDKDEGDQMDITALRMPRFFVGTPEKFLRWQRTMSRTWIGLPFPNPRAVLYWRKGITPAVGVRQAKPLCRVDSYAGCHYNSLHAFKWVVSDDDSRYVRYSWIPEVPEQALRLWQPRFWKAPHRSDPDFLRTELTQRLETWPARFRLEVQIARQNDPVHDASAKWAKGGQRIAVGTLELTEMGPWDLNGDEPLRFDPTRISDGIELPENDRLLPFRAQVYEMSARRRADGYNRRRRQPVVIPQLVPAQRLDPARRLRVSDEDGIDICYDTSGADRGRPLLLIMGFACPMTWWRREFCERLEQRGFNLIRFDNRDSGHSTRVRAKVGRFRSPLRALLGLGAPYTIDDMADDAAGLLAGLEIESAHVMGISLGGMIAQSLAIRHPARVRSLTCINSSPRTRRWPPSRLPSLQILRQLARPQPTGSRASWMDYAMPLWRLLNAGPLPPEDEKNVRELLGVQWGWNRGVDPNADLRQLLAVLASKDRTPALRKWRKPTTIIWGSDDPFVRPVGGVDTFEAIDGARGVEIVGMGHFTPYRTWPIVIQEVDRVAREADGPDDREGLGPRRFPRHPARIVPRAEP